MLQFHEKKNVPGVVPDPESQVFVMKFSTFNLHFWIKILDQKILQKA